MPSISHVSNVSLRWSASSCSDLTFQRFFIDSNCLTMRLDLSLAFSARTAISISWMIIFDKPLRELRRHLDPLETCVCDHDGVPAAGGDA